MDNIYEKNINELEQYFISINEKKFRAKQIFQWLHVKRITDLTEASNVSRKLIDKIQKDFVLLKLKKKNVQESNNGTVKYLFELEDGNLVETVLMKYDYGYSVCISSQVGCNLGCKFCASGRLKKIRSLSAGEMVAQIIGIQQDLDLDSKRVSHVVVMGIGEPFDNYDNVMKFIRIVNDPFGLAIGARHITVSTCGLVDGIQKFQNEKLQVNLAISLHSAIDSVRTSLMPINKRYDLQQLKNAIKEYISITNRRVTFEYILLKGINDSQKDADALAKYIRGINAYVNLIPYNSIADDSFKMMTRDEAFVFYQMLKEYNINVTIRKEHGSDIDAACGQLRSKHK